MTPCMPAGTAATRAGPQAGGLALALVLQLHGTARLVQSGGQAVALERRAAALLALVALEPGVPRERVARWLWPDSADPRRNLRQQLLRFRQQFGTALVDGDALLHLAPGVTLADDDGQPLLAGLPFDDCDELDAWLQAARLQAQARSLQGLRSALAQAEQAGDLDGARQHAQRWLAREPASEAAHHALMRLHYLGGDSTAGLAVFADLQRQLQQAHGGTPGAQAEQLAQALREARRPARAVPAAPPMPATLQRPPRLVGRQRELAAVQAGWASTPVVWLLGEPGLGKSRLIDELLHTRPTSPAGCSLLAQGRPGDAGVPYATLARLLRSCLSAPAAALPPLADGPHRQQLARVLPELAPAVPLPPDGQRLLLQTAVQQLLADARVALVALDDLHFADDASVQMLGVLIGAGGPRRWLLAQRPAEGGSASTALRDALQDDHAMTPVPLAPLDDAAMAELVDSLGLPGVHGHALAADLVRHTGGNPLYALETLKARLLQPAGAEGGAMPRPASVEALIERRLRQLSPAALALARVAALAGTDFDAELAEAVLGSHALGLAEPWAELEAAQVLRDERFCHDLVFEATLRTVPGAVAARVSAQLAAHLEGRDAEPAHIATHWLAARQGLKAVPWLVQAAEQALARYDRVAAAEHHAAAARELLAAGQPDAAFEQHWRCAQAGAELSDLPRIEAVRDALQALARTDAQWSRAHLADARVHDYRGDFDALEAAGARVLDHARRAGDRDMQAEGLACMQAALFYRGRNAEVLPLLQQERAVWQALGRPGAVLRCDYGIGVCLCGLGRLAEAHATLAACVDAYATQGDREMLAHACRELAALDAQMGDAPAALAGLQRTRALLQALQAGEEDWSHLTTQLARQWRRLALPGQALAVLDAFDQRFAADPAGSAGMRRRVHLERGELMLELGRPHLALQALALATRGDASDRMHTVRVAMLRLQLQAAGTAPPATELPVPDPATLTSLPLRLGLARALAGCLPASQRADRLAALVAEADATELVADAMAVRADWVLALLDSGQPGAAARQAGALAEAMQARTPALYPPLAWWALHRALGGPEALAAALDWICRAARDDSLPAAFLPAFLQRQPVNQRVLAAAQQFPALAARAQQLLARLATPGG